MPDDTTTQHRMSAEGADPLLFAGVNDANLQELQRTLGVRISFRMRAKSGRRNSFHSVTIARASTPLSAS